MMRRFLTLAITEEKPNTDDFNVIAMDLQTKDILPLHLSREQIISHSGVIFWDIGFTTEVTGEIKRKYSGNTNSPFIITGTSSLLDNNLEHLEDILVAQSLSAQTFFDNSRQAFCVLEINRLSDINVVADISTNQLKCYIEGTANNLITNKPIVLLNKDYRWCSYWTWTYHQNLFSSKKEKYLTLLNKHTSKLFAILYRHQFKQGSSYWVVGMHWL